MKILHVCPSASRRAGGLFYSVRGLTTAIAKLGIEISVFSGTDSEFDEDHLIWEPICNLVLFKKFKQYKFSFMPNLYHGILSYNPDILHIHGIWSYHAVVALIWKIKFPNKKLIISPRGMLDSKALSISPFVKSIARFLYVNKLIGICEKVLRI